MTISISSDAKTYIEGQAVDIVPEFYFDGTKDEIISNISTINRSARSVIAGNVTVTGINIAGYWNKLKTTKTNLTKSGVIKFLLASGLFYWKNYTWGSRKWGGERISLFTGILEDVTFRNEVVDMIFRDRMSEILDLTVGSDASPIDYYSSSYNPADIAWDVLTTHGGLDSTASTANTDIDYQKWSTWKEGMDGVGFSMEAEYKKKTIKSILSEIVSLTNSAVYVEGDGKIVFTIWLGNQNIATLESYTEDNFLSQPKIKIKRSSVLNKYVVSHGYDPTNSTWVGSITEEDATSESDYGTRTSTQASTSTWHASAASATAFAERALEYTKDPEEEVELEFNAKAFQMQIGDGISMTHSLLGWSSQPCLIEDIRLNSMTGTVSAKGRLVDTGFQFLILDHADYGVIDSDNILF